uniref:GPI transamidase component PIG-S n=1 Tax=Syphacia muris TaxID=451379 RepID=A0A0N5AUJ9_9BILA
MMEAQELSVEERRKRVFQLTASDSRELPYRQASSFIFILIILIFGIPLWWHTTSTYRVSFSNFSPNQRMKIPIFIKIGILRGIANSSFALAADSLVEVLEDLPRIERLDLAYSTEVFFLDAEDDMQTVVADENKFNIYLVLVDDGRWRYGSNVMYFNAKWSVLKVDNNSEIVLQRMQNAVADVLLDIGHLATIIRRDLKKPLSPLEIAALPLNQQKRLIWDSAALSAKYIIQIIVVHTDEEVFKESIFEADEELRDAVLNIRRFAAKISGITDLKISTENLWDFSMSKWLEKDAFGNNSVKAQDVSNIITKIDQQTSTVESSAPLLKLVVFYGKKPIVLVDKTGAKLSSLVVASWGSVTFAGGEMSVSQSLVATLRVLLGLDTDLPPMSERYPSPIAEWELNRLKLRSFVDCSMNAMTSVQAIHNLVAQIDNIVINDQVAEIAGTAVHLIEKALKIAEETGRIEVGMAVEGRVLADQAVNDQSLLALLYFPNDQKFAVYLPLFLPTLLPIFGSIIAFYKRWKGIT